MMQWTSAPPTLKDANSAQATKNILHKPTLYKVKIILLYELTEKHWFPRKAWLNNSYFRLYKKVMNQNLIVEGLVDKKRN